MRYSARQARHRARCGRCGHDSRLAARRGIPLQQPAVQHGRAEVGSLIWQWQSQSPSRIEEWVTLSDSDASIHLAFDGDAIGLQAEPFDWRSCSGDTRLLAWTAHHEPLLELLRAVFRRDWVPESIGDCDAPAARACMRAGFSVAREDGLCVVTGLVDFDPPVWTSRIPRPPLQRTRPLPAGNTFRRACRSSSMRSIWRAPSSRQ